MREMERRWARCFRENVFADSGGSVLLEMEMKELRLCQLVYSIGVNRRVLILLRDKMFLENVVVVVEEKKKKICQRAE